MIALACWWARHKLMLKVFALLGLLSCVLAFCFVKSRLGKDTGLGDTWSRTGPKLQTSWIWLSQTQPTPSGLMRNNCWVSLMIQWLKLPFHCGNMGLISGWGSSTCHMVQPIVIIKNNKNKIPMMFRPQSISGQGTSLHRFYKCGWSPALAIQGADWPVASEGPSLTRNLPVWIATCIPETVDQGPPTTKPGMPWCRYSKLPAEHTLESCKAERGLWWVCFGKLLKWVPIGRDCSCLSSSRVPKPARTLGNWGTSDHRGGAKLVLQLLVVPRLSPLVCRRGLGVYFAHRFLARSTVVPW